MTTRPATLAPITASEVATGLGYLHQGLTVRQARAVLFDVDTNDADRLRRLLTDVDNQDGLTVAAVRAHFAACPAAGNALNLVPA